MENRKIQERPVWSEPCRVYVNPDPVRERVGIRNAYIRTFMSDEPRVFGKRILLVDDDQGARESIKLLLNIDRHSVVEAQNGQEALELFHQGILDLVIIDYFMPQMEGSELAANIKHAAPLLPILMVTAYLEKLVDAVLPVDAILAKPFGIAELRQAIAKLLN
jgi:CheY-like chemotaxis protein